MCARHHCRADFHVKGKAIRLDRDSGFLSIKLVRCDPVHDITELAVSLCISTAFRIVAICLTSLTAICRQCQSDDQLRNANIRTFCFQYLISKAVPSVISIVSFKDAPRTPVATPLRRPRCRAIAINTRTTRVRFSRQWTSTRSEDISLQSSDVRKSISMRS